jgi:flagellar assembly protein FliH
MSSSSRPTYRNVPPPPGSKPASAYTRFIPREELQDFAAWSPDSFSGQPNPQERDAEPVETTEAQWREQIAAARQSGYQDGYRDGLVALEGFKQSFATQMTAQIGQLLTSMDNQFMALEEQMAHAVSGIAVRLARQVLRSELVGQPELVAQVATEAVGAVLLSARQITVLLHPADLPLVAQAAAEALQARGARLVADASLERGGCRVESDLGAVDARIGERWAQAASALGSELPWAEGQEAQP